MGILCGGIVVLFDDNYLCMYYATVLHIWKVGCSKKENVECFPKTYSYESLRKNVYI